jgi:hypothetical protein
MKPPRERSCDGKVRHATEAAARTAAEQVTHLVAYRCRYCSGWHLGHQSKRSVR